MSASEKLKALDVKAVGPQTYCPEPREWNEVAEDVVAALPQIVAVVEAAEAVSAEYDTIWPPEDTWTDGPAQCFRALAALDEALS